MIRTFLIAVTALSIVSIAAPARGQTVAEGNVLRPGDVVTVRVWREDELSGMFTVQEDGTVVLPRLGSYMVAGRDEEEVRQEIIAEYARTLRDPVVEVGIRRRITITGEVRSPGLYPVDTTMRLTDALTLAGGPLPNAKENRVVLIRGGERTELDVQEALAVRDLALQSGDQLYVPKKNWFVRNWQFYTSILGTVMSVYTFIAVRNR